MPVKFGCQGVGLGNLAFADEEGESAPGLDTGGRDGEDRVETLDRAEGDEFGLRGEVLSAVRGYIDVRQCKGADDFAQEGDFLVLGFEEGGAEARRPELDGEAGESGAGADVEKVECFGWRLAVGNARGSLDGRRGACGTALACAGGGACAYTRRKQGLGSEERFAKVAGDDGFGVTDGGEVGAGVPAEK